MNSILFSFMVPLYLVAPPHFIEGEAQLKMQNWAQAAESFDKAIASKELYGPYIPMAYWNLFRAYDNINDIDNAAEALLGFLVHSMNFIDRIKIDRVRRKQFIKIWIKSYNIEEKIKYGYAVLQAMWASQSDWSCRSKMFACFIEEKNLIKEFKKRIPFCSESTFYNMNLVEDDNFIRADVTCTNKVEQYYFVQP